MSDMVTKLNELAEIIKNMSDEELAKRFTEYKPKNPEQYAQLERIILNESDKIEDLVEEATLQANKKYGW